MPEHTAMATAARRIACEAVGAHAEFRALSSVPGIQIDLRYASANNFVRRNLYGDIDCAWLHVDAAHGLAAAAQWLRQQRPDVQLIVLDALRPHRVQVQLWQHLEGTELRQYLADPARGSIHSFGMALDVTLLDERGAELDMGTGFDDLSPLSHPEWEAQHLAQGLLTQTQIDNRLLLRRAMTENGFKGIHSEWWHFDFGDKEQVRQNYWRVE